MSRYLWIALLLLAACGQESASNISTSDLKKPCDCVEAYRVFANEFGALLKGKKGEGDLSADEKEELAKLDNHFKGIDKHCKQKFEHYEIRSCATFQQVKEQYDEISSFGGNPLEEERKEKAKE